MSRPFTDLAGLDIGAEDFLAAVLETAGQPLFVVDHTGVIRFANPATVATLGYDEADELLGRPSLETIHTESPTLLARTTGETVHRELDWFARRDGSMLPVSYVSVPIAMPQGRGAVVAFTEVHDRLRAQEQASLRRVATIVADGTASDEVFTAIAREVAQLLDMAIVNIWRFERDGTATVTGTWSARSTPLQPGTNWSLEAPPIAAMARQIQAGRPARIDLPQVAGALAGAARDSGLRAGAGAPIVVGGEVWGMMGIGAADGEPLPDHIEDRLVEFTDLVATAIANTAARAEAARLAEEQAALRRVATLVAREASQADVFTAIAEEIAHLLGADHIRMVRFEGERAIVVGSSGAIEDPLFGGSGVPLGGDNAVSRVFRTRQPARIDDYGTASGAIAQSTSAMGIRGVVVTPILVEGRLWGAIGAGTRQAEPLPPETEFRLSQFTELMATAIANTESRATAERLAGEQAALRRVATLVAKGAPPAELFAMVVEEVASVLGEVECLMVRDEGDGTASVAASRGAGFEAGFPVGTRLPVDGDGVTASVLRTGEPWRTKDYSTATGILAERAHAHGIRSAVGCPIRVGGRIWGVIGVARSDDAVLPPETETRITQFSDLLATAIANAAARTEVERLAEEQAALRRVATLVARGASPTAVFDAVAGEMEGLLQADEVWLNRYESGAEATIVARRGQTAARVVPGTRFNHDERPNVTAIVRSTERPARIEHSEGTSAAIAELLGTRDLRVVVGAPLVVDGRLWGAIAAGWIGEEAPPADTEQRMAQFAQLLDTAIANSASRGELARLAEEQAALRRVATLVARGLAPDAVFAAITQEAGRLLGVDAIHLGRYEPGGTVTGVATWGAGTQLPLGTNVSVAGDNVTASVLSTGRAARMDSYEGAGGAIAELMRDTGMRSSVGAPILVDQRLWGVMIASSRAPLPLPADTEVRIAAFTEIAATAIANTEARSELRALADEQAALRRVATLVAQDVPPHELFAAVAREAGTLLGADFSGMLSYEDNATVATAATWAAVGQHPPVPARFPTEPGDAMAIIARTRAPARVVDWAALPGPIAAFIHTELGVRCSVGSPVVVQGRLWGALAIHSKQSAPLPTDTEARLAQFTDLVGTAIANADARAEVARLADEQAALRRVATLVAEGASATAVFDAVAGEMQRLLNADQVALNRYEPGNEITVVAFRGPDAPRVAIGMRWSHEGENATAIVRRTERPVRIEHRKGTRGPMAEFARASGVSASVGAPIVVNGRLWGLIAASWSGDQATPADTEERMAQFAELLDTAIANADSRDQLTASRTRLLTAADDARRRVVRDLHDGAQQRLVHTIINLKLAKRALRAKDAKAESLVLGALEQAERGNLELRELAHGILPAALTSGGLQAGVDAVVTRLNLPIHVDVPAERFSPELEASAYFIVAEALTNIIKHAHARRGEVRVSVADGLLHVEVRDDGIGGADRNGRGLVGIRDRATTLGGRLSIQSPAGGGTLVAATLPLSAG